ncbi:MAG: hypothetical protein ACLR8Y_00010 [Alistipes indistinctus]
MPQRFDRRAVGAPPPRQCWDDNGVPRLSGSPPSASANIMGISAVRFPRNGSRSFNALTATTICGPFCGFSLLRAEKTGLW